MAWSKKHTKADREKALADSKYQAVVADARTTVDQAEALDPVVSGVDPDLQVTLSLRDMVDLHAGLVAVANLWNQVHRLIDSFPMSVYAAHLNLIADAIVRQAPDEVDVDPQLMVQGEVPGGAHAGDDVSVGVMAVDPNNPEAAMAQFRELLDKATREHQTHSKGGDAEKKKKRELPGQYL